METRQNRACSRAFSCVLRVSRDFWLAPWKKAAIIDFQGNIPPSFLFGSRFLQFSACLMTVAGLTYRINNFGSPILTP